MHKLDAIVILFFIITPSTELVITDIDMAIELVAWFHTEDDVNE